MKVIEMKQEYEKEVGTTYEWEVIKFYFVDTFVAWKVEENER